MATKKQGDDEPQPVLKARRTGPHGQPANTPAATRLTYPRASAVNRMVAIARKNGIAVDHIVVTSDGTIRIGQGSAPTPSPESEFDRWDAAGKL